MITEMTRRQIEILELFAETAPTMYDPGSLFLWRTPNVQVKRERDAAWKAANPARVREHRLREFAKRRERRANKNKAG